MQFLYIRPIVPQYLLAILLHFFYTSRYTAGSPVHCVSPVRARIDLSSLARVIRPLQSRLVRAQRRAAHALKQLPNDLLMAPVAPLSSEAVQRRLHGLLTHVVSPSLDRVHLLLALTKPL